ncbi:MAG TPA: hypothetical protein VM925_21625 [Labilithrix sp.]|nr:hypothetical protein [Labilithrix sp.]
MDEESFVVAAARAAAGLRGVTVGAGRFVAVGPKGTVMTSSDGSTWTERAVAGACDFGGVVFTGDRFVAVGGGWSGGACAAESPDGERWTAVGGAPESEMFHSVAILDGRTVIGSTLLSDLGYPGVFALDGGTFTRLSTDRGHATVGLRCAADGPGPAGYLVGGSRGVWSAEAQGEWQPTAIGPTDTTTQFWGLARGSGRLVAVGQSWEESYTTGGDVYVRDDATGRWTSELHVSTGMFVAVAHRAGRFVAVGEKGTIATSANGGRWSVLRSPLDESLISIVALP